MNLQVIKTDKGYVAVNDEKPVKGDYQQMGLKVVATDTSFKIAGLPQFELPAMLDKKYKQYSENDLIKAIEMARTLKDDKQEFEVESILGSSDGTYGIEMKYSVDDITNSFKNPKTLVAIIVKEKSQKIPCPDGKEGCLAYHAKLVPVILKEANTELLKIIEYIYK